MGMAAAVFKALLKRTAAKGAKAAIARGKRATKHYCPVTDGRHHMTKWMNEEHPNTGKVHGPGIHTVFYCKECGWTQ